MFESQFHKEVVAWNADGSIPKVVYRTVPSILAMPQSISKTFHDLILANKNWQQIVFDDVLQQEYILSHCTQRVIDSYFQLNPAYGPARADLFRYLIVYQNGGVYLDQKSGVVSSLDLMISPSDQYLLAPVDITGKKSSPHKRLRPWSGVEYMQWLIASVPGHPFLAAVITRVLRNIERYRPLFFGVGKKGVLNVTGPVAYTCAIAPIAGQFPHRLIDAHLQGWRYTMLESTTAHFNFSHIHYSRLSTPIVQINPNAILVRKLWIWVETLIARFIGKLSVINHDRLQLRREKRGCRKLN